MRERKVIIAGILLIAAILSCTVGGKIASSTDTYTDSIASIDKSIGDALKLTTAATSTSVVISMLKDDIATPISEQFADFTDYLLLIVIILLAEKYLVPILGMAAFRIIIPASCILILVGLLSERESLKNAGKKLIIAGIAVSFLIPASTTVSNTIREIYGNNIQETIEEVDKLSSNAFTEGDQTAEEAPLPEAETEGGKASASLQETDNEESSDKNKFGNFFNGIGTSITNAASTVSHAVLNAVDSIFDSAKDKFDYFTGLVKNFVESIAVMVVTSCIVPIVVLVAFVSMLKFLFGIDISGVYDLPNRIKKQRNRFREGKKESEEKELAKIN